MTEVNKIVIKIRREPFRMFGNNCLRKSLKFRRLCRGIGINVRVVFALVITPCKRFPLPPRILWFHTWAEIDGQRIELARPLNERNTANTYDIDLKPIVAIWI